METLIKKHNPKNLSNIVGQPLAVSQLVSFIREFPKKTALILHGPTGTGKTSIVYAFAAEFKYEVLEINASDSRNKSSIEAILAPASQQHSLFGNKKIILVDEIDSISGTHDRGGVPAIVEIVKNTKFPIIFTANDAFNKKLSTLRKYCIIAQLNKIDSKLIAQKLKEICSQENISAEDLALCKIASAAQGDLRAAINDLQMLGNNITSEKTELWGRAQEESIFNAMKKIFKSEDTNAALESVDSISEDYDALQLWLDENIPKEYSGESLARAYDSVSRADIFNAHIRKRQHWRFLVYVRSLLVSGVQHARDSVKTGFVKHSPPGLLLKLWRRAAKVSKEKAELEELAVEQHASTRRLRRSFLPYWKFVKKTT